MSRLRSHKTTRQNQQELSGLFGMSDRRKKEKRNGYRQALIGAGIDQARLQRWPIDEWKAGEKLAIILQRGGQKGVEFINSNIGPTQQITKSFANSLVTKFDAYLTQNNIDTSSINPINLPSIDTKSGFANTVENLPSYLENLLGTANKYENLFSGDDSKSDNNGNNQVIKSPDQAGYNIPWTKLALTAGGTVIIGLLISKYSS